jgi:cyclophilin family peptidyl-prolyl cis-trans isomerase
MFLTVLNVLAAFWLQAPAPQAVAAIETCGSDRTLAAPERLTRETLLLAIDRRLFSPCTQGEHGPFHLEERDRALIVQALASSTEEMRRIAVRGVGQMASPSMVPLLVPRLDDASAAVRMEAANAIGQSLSGLRSDLRTDPPATPAQVREGQQTLAARFDKETDDRVAVVILATMGWLRFPESDVPGAEAWIVERTAGSPERLVGAAEGLRALADRNRRRPLTEDARVRLRDISTLGRGSTRASAASLIPVRRAAMLALQAARDNDVTTMIESAADADWQVRRIAVAMMNPSIAQLRPSVLALLGDPQLHVRIDAVTAFARGLQTINDCTPLLKAASDPAMPVALAAIGALTSGCRDLPAIVSMLTAEADRLTMSGPNDWHKPARALTALARVAPAEARTRLAAAQRHAVWQVRATVATAAGVVSEAAVATALAADSQPNVRTAAIDALVRMKAPDVAVLAIPALESIDFQLVRAAARALQGATHEAAVPALLTSLRRLTAEGADTSRDPRVAIVERLTELLGPSRVAELADWTGDWDPAVRAAARKAFTDAKTDIPARPMQFRYPLQPTAEQLRDALTMKQADIELASGAVITMDLLTEEAPLTVWRFVSRARSGAYNGLTFHRVVPNFVIQGLSPGANEYMGDSRFMRDEASLATHQRGAVGISTRGYDTGDTQIFFDLVDVPRLNHDYTVFAQVTAGMEHLDLLAEGAAVTRVVIR